MKPGILFVDDDKHLLNSIKRMLSSFRNDWDLHFGDCVDKGWQIINNEKIDIVISDINMPEKDGFHLLELIKTKKNTKNIEVVMITGLKDSELKRKALSNGATDLLGKPIQKEDLIARIKNTLKLKLSQDQLKLQNVLLQDQLIYSQQIETMGMLSGGVVHDLKNMLMIIQNYPLLIKIRLDNDQPIEEILEKIEKVSKRAGVMTNQILNLTKQHEEVVDNCNLLEILNDSIEIVKPMLSHDVQTETDIQGSTFGAEANHTQILQVFLNIIINAKQAMPKGGKIFISASIDNIKNNTDIKDGIYNKFIFTDNGIGMNENLITRIFEPRFSTKKSKGGFGIGLYVLKIIIERHSGYIMVNSKENVGTSFTIYIPWQKENNE